jgi:hypothetical protein
MARVRVVAFGVASVVAYVGMWLISSVFSGLLLDMLSRTGRDLSWHDRIVWTMIVVLIGAVQAATLWVCGVRTLRSLVLRTFGSVALTAVIFVALDVLAMFLSSLSLSFRIISATAGVVVAIVVAGTPVLVSLIPRRSVEPRHRVDVAT